MQPSHGPRSGLPRPTLSDQELAEQLSADLAARLDAGESAKVESYLDIYPWLRNRDAVLLALLATEVASRTERGETADLNEYRRRFPQLIDRVPEVLARRRSVGTTTGTAIDTTKALPPGVLPEHVAFLRPPATPDDLGILGPYRISRVLGRGGMGIVFHALEESLGRAVALKVMLPEVAATFANRQRFLREARAMAAVEHPHVVPVYRVDEDNGVPYMAMPFLKGRSLATRLKAGPLPTTEVIRLGREMTEGLAAAHKAGIVHRDIKPDNVWLRDIGGGGEGVAVLLDFGLARDEQVTEALTRTGAILGTPHYMAPEQASGSLVDVRADLFSLGCVLYEMTTGRRPFDGTNPISILYQIANHEPLPLQEVRPGVPAVFSDLVQAMMAKNRDDRPASAGEVVRRLKAIDSPKSVASMELPPLTVVDPPGPAAGPTGQRWRVPLLLASVGVPIVLTTLVWFLFLRPRPEPTPLVEQPRPDETVVPKPPLPVVATDPIAPKTTEAQAAFQRHDYTTALSLVNESLLADPDQSAALELRAEIYRRRGRLEEALEDADRAVRQGPDSPAALSLRSLIQFGRGMNELALDDAERAVAADPDSAIARAARAFAAGSLHHDDRALEDGEVAIERDPQQPLSWMARGFARGVAGDFPRAITDYDKAIALDPQRAGAYAGRGRWRLLAGQEEEAFADFDKAVQLDPSSALWRMARSRAHLMSDRPNDAVRDADEAVRLDPRSFLAYLTRGLARSAQGKDEMALEDCQEAVLLEPRSALALEAQALVYLGQKEFDQAQTAADKAVKLDPDGSARRVRGYCHLLRKDFPAALADFSNALDRDPTPPADLFLYRGRAAEGAGNAEQAQADFAEYRKRTGQEPPPATPDKRLPHFMIVLMPD